MFNLKKNFIYRAVKLDRIVPPDIVRGFIWLFFILAIFLFLVFIKPGFLGLSSEQILGLFIISILITTKGALYLAFFNALKSDFACKLSLVDEISSGRNVKNLDLGDYLGFRMARAIMRNKKLTPFNVVYSFWQDERGQLVFEKLGLEKKMFKQKIKENKDSQEFIKILEKAALLAGQNFHRHIEMRDFLVAAAEEDYNFRKILSINDLDSKDVDQVAAWEDLVEHEIKRKKQFWRLENLMRKRGIGKRWAAGYTVNLDRYSVEINDIIKKQNLSIYLMSHRKEIYAIERILARSGSNNVLLVGRPGVGRTTIAYAFAKKIAEGRSFSHLNDKRILELDIQAALAGLTTEGEMLDRLKIILSEAVLAGNVILLIDEIHNYLGLERGPGAINIGPVIQPYLASSNFQVIGITNYEGWHKYIETNPSIKNLFVKVEISEPSSLQTILILEDMLPGLERQYKVSVNYRVLRDVVELADQYIQDVPFPGKAIDILTEVLVYTKGKGERKVLPEYVNRIISERTEVPVGIVMEEERQKLLDLENRIHQRVIDQEEAVKLISEAMRRARAGVKTKDKPIGSFLFLGPTGVGKTETSKALAEAYFGSDKKMIRFDMSEYQQNSSIGRLIGLPEKGEPGLLTRAISDDPFSLLLLDEIEKAYPNILNLFLQVLDEGWLTDAFGRRVSFSNSIIIGTSNAGSELIRQKVKEGISLESFKENLIDYLLKQGIFNPEFLNRFDAVVVFRPLAHQHLIEIAKLMLNNLSKRLIQGMGIRLVISPELVEKIAELGYKPEFGARPMKRVIQDKIESQIAKRILEQDLKRGDFIEIKAEALG